MLHHFATLVAACNICRMIKHRVRRGSKLLHVQCCIILPSLLQLVIFIERQSITFEDGHNCCTFNVALFGHSLTFSHPTQYRKYCTKNVASLCWGLADVARALVERSSKKVDFVIVPFVYNIHSINSILLTPINDNSHTTHKTFRYLFRKNQQRVTISQH